MPFHSCQSEPNRAKPYPSESRRCAPLHSCRSKAQLANAILCLPAVSLPAYARPSVPYYSCRSFPKRCDAHQAYPASAYLNFAVLSLPIHSCHSETVHLTPLHAASKRCRPANACSHRVETVRANPLRSDTVPALPPARCSLCVALFRSLLHGFEVGEQLTVFVLFHLFNCSHAESAPRA